MKARFQKHTAAIGSSELILRPDGSVYHLGIRGEHVANKVIIVGDPERVPLISRHFEKVDTKVAGREFVVHTGEFSGKRITVVSSGIGVDNIDILMNELDAAVNVNLQTRLPYDQHTSLEIVRIGTSGTLQKDIPVGSFVASAAAFGLDGVPQSYEMEFDTQETNLMDALASEFDHLQVHKGFYGVYAHEELLGRIAGEDCIRGITATANGFYGPQGRTVRLQSRMSHRIDAYAGFMHGGLSITNFEMECSGIYALSSLLGHKATTVCAILANRATKEFHNNPSASMETLIQQVLQRF
jgi:uridine phosphorylase